ncbi:MAG: hypothetical protein ABN482_11110 [Corticimicrobacter sp.]|uniref:hypothetical protein n=1 Tax=Corticimicrobacter sp. TaxID=2678536 RepID=UPI0032D9B30D
MHTRAATSSIPSPTRTYMIRTAAFMGIYVLLNLAAILGVFDGILGQAFGWILAVAVALPVAAQIWATLRLMADSDEYVRAIVAKNFIISAGATMALWSTWGFGETYAAAPHLPGWLIYPVFWGIYALVSPFVRTSR